jgi:acyl-coenzyme A synthetase/AMP-(fatty) acid ligase
MNSELICTAKLHKDLTIYQQSQNRKTFYAHSRDEFIGSVQHWKNILGEQANVRLGDKIGVGIELLNLRYASLLYAISELGGINLILDKVAVGSDRIPRCRVLAPFDLYVVSETADQSIINIGDWYSNKQLRADIWFDYTSTQPHVFSDQIVPLGSDLFMQTPSSGSVGTPKVIEYTHNWLSLLGDYCAKVLGYQSTDRILHLTNLHHGGSSGVFFFPTMQHCQHHYFDHGLDASVEKQKDIVNLIVEKQINKVLFPNSLLLDQVLKSMPTVDHDCCFYSLQANQKSWIQESHRTGINIVSIFGSSETLGPIFINTIDSNTPDIHNVLNYGKPLAGFYSVEVKHQHLQVLDITGKVNILNDKFNVDQQGNYYYNSRSDLIRINDVTLEFSDLHRITLTHFDDLSAALLADSTTNKIYLLLDNCLKSVDTTSEKISLIDSDLKTINSVLKIDHVDFIDIQSLLTGIKLDRAAAVAHFRKKFNLI